MLEFLLKRPIAVSMSFIAVVLLGFVSVNYIPVSLLPNVEIPEISIQVNYKNASARELENTVVKPLRRQLMQVAHLDDIKSETRDGSSIIRLKLNYGTNINLAYIEVNEKVDRMMGSLPREISRPKVIKASASDIPVFYLSLYLKNNVYSPTKFLELSEFSDVIIRKRLEQLSEVAMVDITGRLFSEILILPDNTKMQSLGLNELDIENLIVSNNVDYGNLSIKDGHYLYSIRFSSQLKTKEDIENLYLKLKNSNRLIQLKDIARVNLQAQKSNGLSMINGVNSIKLAIIKQSDAQVNKMEEALSNLIKEFENDYPEIAFEVSQDQTKLLDYSISNLKSSLYLGAIFAFLLMFLFLKDFKSPWLIGITIPTSIIISLLFFYIFDISINIISLSGLVLGVGMMIDNSIIVIDNIAQYRMRGASLFSACAKGTQEVIRPMLSSVLTTCAVFIPLIFISGIAGSLFYDQAMAVSIGLFVSLLVSISLLPVYYLIFYKRESKGTKLNSFFKFISLDYNKLYEKGLKFTFRNQAVVITIFTLLMVLGLFLLVELPKDRLPKIEETEQILEIDWGEGIHIDENKDRVQKLLTQVRNDILQSSVEIGEQQFLLNRNNELSASECRLYLKMESEIQKNTVCEILINNIRKVYPEALIKVYAPANLFEQVFSKNEAPLVAQLSSHNQSEDREIELLNTFLLRLKTDCPQKTDFKINTRDYVLLTVDPVRLLNYDIETDFLYRKLRTLFNANKLFTIKENQNQIPIILGSDLQNISQIINDTQIKNTNGNLYPLRELVKLERRESLKTIESGKEGNIYPIAFNIIESDLKSTQSNISNLVLNYPELDLSFSGSIFSNKKLVNELILILIISLFLLYFILASQFESFSLPLIVLLEVPIDIGGALLVLWLAGGSINLMSMIGIIVMTGIIINDSILKIDTINKLRQNGAPLMKAIAVAGQRRLKPILMTSLTTIFALLPFLFAHGLGSDLQKPLAYTVIGGMSIGTIVSLYFVPLCYYYLYRKKKV